MQNPWHWIIDEPKFSYAEKLVAIVFVRHQDRSGWSWPSAERISRLAGLSRSKVYEAIASLRQKNALRSRQDGYLTKFRIEQVQGLLFAPPDQRQIDREEVVEIGTGKTVDGCGNPSTWWNRCPPGGLEDRKEYEDRKSISARANPARGFPTGKVNAKQQRIIVEIERLKAAYAGAGPSDRGDIAGVERRIELLRAELARTGWQDARAG